MSGPSIPAPSAGFKDMRAGLMVFGILEIILGALCLMLVLGMAALLLFMPQTNAALSPGMIRLALAIYVGLSATFIWLGIGSIQCRRWAHALLLMLSWSWLLAGMIGVLFNFFYMRALTPGDLPDSPARLVFAVIMIFQVILFVILPGAMVLFYRSPHVKATCAAHDPGIGWTDRCPLPVLTSALWLALGAVSLLVGPTIRMSVVPFFGSLLTGAPATIILVLCAVFWIYLAWGTYRLRMSAWRMTLIFFAVGSASSAVTFAKVSILELYQKLGYPEQQISQLRGTQLLSGKAMAWWSIGFFLLFLVFMLWIRKYFLPVAVIQNQIPPGKASRMPDSEYGNQAP
jgi:hypothetical protein